MDALVRLVIAPSSAIQPGGLIDARKGYPTCDDSPEGREAAERHIALSDEPMTVHRCRRDGTWWVLAPLLSTVYGDIETLLRRGSVVLSVHVHRQWVVDVLPAGTRTGEHGYLADRGTIAQFKLTDVALDLSDATSRWQAASWAQDQDWDRLPSVDRALLVDLMGEARRNRPMTPEQIDTLCRLVLRLAGRS